MSRLTLAYGDEDDGLVPIALEILRHSILRPLAEQPDGWCLNLRGLGHATGLPRETIRGLIADMRAERLIAFQIGLWSDDGEPMGAGFSITKAGRAVIAPPTEPNTIPPGHTPAAPQSGLIGADQSRTEGA